LYSNYFSKNNLDIFVVPTIKIPAPKIGATTTCLPVLGEVPTLHAVIQNTDPTSVVGYPCLTLPVGRERDEVGEFFVGVELVAAEGKDEDLLEIAKAVFDVIKC
jgi:Asp-tRNA(Asn)/Glu-tRNA(Gln) amidotransferase A subunit family amidase